MALPGKAHLEPVRMKKEAEAPLRKSQAKKSHSLEWLFS
jgi:hypothetical protein